MFKYLPFSAGKTAHLDRLCLENSRKDSRANVGRLLLLLLLPGKGPGSSLNVFGPAGLSKTGKNSRVPKASIKTG